MSAAIEPVTPQTITVHEGGGVDMIAKTAGQLGQAFQIAEAICGTQFAPQHFRGQPHDAAAAILYGAQVGLDPLTALQNLYVIGGRPALYARTMQAIVQAAGHSIWTEDSSDSSVTVCGQRAGSEAIERVTWTIERAQTAGYTTNKNYQKDPQAMLYARATGDVCRRIAPDALLGMAYTVEEMRVSAAAQESQRGTGTRPAAETSSKRAPQRPQAPTPSPGEDRDWYAELDQAKTKEEVKRIGAAIGAAGRMDEFRDTLNALWASMQEAETESSHGESVNPETGEVINTTTEETTNG